MNKWNDKTIAVNERFHLAVEALPLFIVRDREIFTIDLFEVDMFWLKEVDEGLPPYHFGFTNMGGTDFLEMFKDHKEAYREYQKQMKLFYDQNYDIYSKVVTDLDEFKTNNLEVFI